MLESFYPELRRRRVRCSGKPFIEKHYVTGHDCAKSGCKPHKCCPMAASTVRQIHAILSGALAAERWDWIAASPARIARRPQRCFDSIEHSALMDRVRARVKAKRVLFTGSTMDEGVHVGHWAFWGAEWVYPNPRP